MNLQALIHQLRIEVDDLAGVQFWSDASLTMWLNEAQTEACERARLLLDDETPEVARIALVAGQASYPVHEALNELVNVHDLSNARYRVQLRSREWLDSNCPGWRDGTYETGGCIRFANVRNRKMTLVPTPKKAGELHIEGYRRPLNPMELPTDSPEIDPVHHRKLLHWATHKAFSVPDAEVFDARRAQREYEAFELHFGMHPGSGLRADTREDEPQNVVPFWP